jgi:tape measure domain-containing protein
VDKTLQDKTLQLTLNINADTSGLNKSLAGVGAGVKRIKVPVEIDAGNLGETGQQIGKSFQAEASKTKVGLRTDQAGEIGSIIAKSVVKGVEDSLKDAGRNIGRGNLLGALGSVVSAPFKIAGNVASTVIGGALSSTRIAATSALQGLVNGIGIEVTRGVGTGLREGVEQKIASTFGSTEVIGRTAASQLLQQLGKAAQGIEERVSGAESPFRGVAAVIKSEFQRLVETAFDPQEVLAVSRAAQRRAQQQRGQIEEDAKPVLRAQQQQELVKYNDFKEQKARINAETQAKREQIRAQVATEGPELRRTVENAVERSQAPTQRLAEVNTSRQEILDTYEQSSVADRIQAKRKFEDLSTEAKSLEVEIAALQSEVDQATSRANYFSSEFDRLAKIDQELNQIGKQIASRAKESVYQLRSVGSPEERREEIQRQLAETEKAEIAAKNRQKEILALRKRGIEVGRQVAAKAQEAFASSDQEKFIDLSAEADLAVKLVKQLEQEFQELAQSRQVLESRAKKLEQKRQEIPEPLPAAIKQAYLDLAGRLPTEEEIPRVRERTTETLGVNAAQYSATANALEFRAETLAVINSGKRLTEEQLKELYEEVAHSLQFDFGKITDPKDFIRLSGDATSEQIEPILRELAPYKEETRPAELDAKIIRDQKVAQALVRQELQSFTESLGRDGADLYKLAVNRINAAQASLDRVASDSVETGVEFNPKPFEKFILRLADLARNTTAEFARLSVEDFSPQRVELLLSDVKKTLHYLDGLDQQIAAAAAKQKASQVPTSVEPVEQGGALAVAKENVSDLGGIVQRVGGVLAPLGGVAEGTVHALAVVGKAGLALADKFGFAAASLIPGGALAYGPAKAVVKNVVGPLTIAGVASQVPGVGEVLGVLQSAIGALIAPETVGLANGVSQAVTAELHSALPTLFSTLSRGLAESGLPGAGLSAQAVNSIGGLLIHTLEPVVAGVTSTADATITAVGGATQELLSQLAAALVAGKVVQEGAKLATSEDARAGALKGIEAIGSGLGQVVGGVQDGIQDAADAIDRTKRAVQKNIEGIKGAAERVAQGDIRAVGDAVEETQAAVGNLTRGVQDVAKASTEAVQNVVEGTGKVIGVFGDLRSVKLPDGIDLVDLAQDQLLKIQQQLRQKLENVLDAEAKGLPVIGGSSTVKRDLEIVGQVLEAKYEVVVDHVGSEVQKQIEAVPLDLPIKIAPLPELEPLVVEPRPQAQKQAIGQPVISTSKSSGQGDNPSPIEVAQQQINNATPKSISVSDLFAEIDAAIEETDNEIKAVYAYFSEVVAATKKAIKKGDVEAIARNTSEAKRVAGELSSKIAELQDEIPQTLQALEQEGLDIGPTSAIGERLRKVKSALGQKAALIPQRLADIGVRPTDAELTTEIDSGVSAHINPALAALTDALNQKAAQLKAALSNLVEAAKTNPKVVNTAKDLAVIGTGIAASTAVSDHGQVASLAAELIATITARGALAVGSGAEGDLIGALQRLTVKLNDPATQKQLGTALFGDILGFATSHVTDAVTGIPGSGAVAANTIVPKLQQLRGQTVPVDGLDLEPVANKNTEIESVLDDLQQIAAASEKVDATVGDRIALFFLSLRNAYSKAPTSKASQEIKDALDLLEGTLAGAGAGIGKETEQAIAESEQQLGKVEKQFAKIEQQIAEAERLADRAEEIVGGRELGQRETGSQFDARLATSQGSNSTSQAEADKKTQQQLAALEAERQRRITELDSLIASETERIGDEKAEQIVSLKRQRANLDRPIEQYQAEDLGQFVTPKVTVTPTGEERGLVAQQRIERDASDRQINDALRTGKSPTGSPDEIQLMADSAIANFEKNFAKFNATAEQIENGSTRAQKALRSVGEGVTTFRQKLDEAGGVSGVLGKIGQSLSNVAEKAGLPVNTIGKLGNIIKGVGIAALAYVGVTQLGDAIVTAGRAAFQSAINLERLQTRLRFVAGSDSAAGEDLDFLRKKSEELKLPLQGLIEQYTQFKISSKGTSVEGGKTKEAFEGLIRAGRVLGLTQENIANVTAQVGQAFRKQNADTEDLKTIAEGGIPIFEALSRVMGKSTADVQKSIEAGEVTAEIIAKALKLVGDEAKSGLPAALATAASSIDDFKKTAEDLGEKVGPFLLAGFSVGVEGVIAGIKLLEQAGDKLSPVFDAIANGAGLLLDIASPIVGVIGALAGAIGGDLLDGIAIPFQAINAGLIEIREGFTAVVGVTGQALSAIGEQAAALGVAIPYLGEIIKYANPATIAVRLLGAAIGVFLVGQMIRMGVAVGSVVIPALISMAGTMTATVIPAIGAAVTASLAFIATPLGATIAAIGVIAAIAAPHMDELANSIAGLGDAQVKANDRATQFNNDYQKSLGQLQKGIPLTAEELKKLKDGFAQNVKEGKDTASTAEKLSANLDRMQASAEAAAQIQAKLTKAMADATKAIKSQSQAIDAGYSTRLAGLNEALANQQITRERFDQEELAAQGEKSGKYLELYKTQGDNLRNALSEANARLAAPLPDATRTEVKKQVEQLQDQIYEIEQKGGEQRIALAQNRVKVTENIEKDRAKRAENEVKALENILAAGTTAQIDVEQNISAVKQSETKRRIAEIDKQLKTEVGASGKLSEIAKNLYSERAVLETELSKIASEEATKRYDILLKDLEKTRDKLSSTITEAETEANIELQNAQNAGLLKQAEVEAKKTDLTRTRLQKDLALELAAVETLESLPSPTDPEKAEEHQKRIREGKLKTAQITQQIAENEYKRQESIRNLAAKALDEQVKGVENAATAIEQVGKLASNSLERQNKILEAQKSLRASIVSLHDEEFKILIETETNEKDKATLQEKAAKFRLDSLRQSQALEERILDLQIKQEQVQSRVAIAKAQAAVAKAEVEQKKVNDNPESTEGDKQTAAASLLTAKIDLGAAFEAARLQEGLAELNRQKTQANNQKELLGARFEYAKAIVDPSDRRDAIERVQATAARGLRERDQNLLPIGNKRIAPPPDYTQLDSASQQLGLTPKGVNLGRFIPPTPVDLHSGLNVQGLQQVGELGAQLKELRLLTQSGVAANLVTLVQQNQALSSQLLTLASRPQVQQNNYVQPPKRSSVLAGSGL